MPAFLAAMASSLTIATRDISIGWPPIIPSSRSWRRARAGPGKPRSLPCSCTSAISGMSLHGWSPKYHTADLKHEIARRLQDRVLFAADYPLFSYERLIKDWRAQGYSEAVLEKVFLAQSPSAF